MYGREELKTYTSCELYDQRTDEFKSGEAFLKEEADKVMDAMEARIKELEATISKMETTTPKWISVKDVLPQWGKLVKIKFKYGKEDERRFSADYKLVSKGMQACESVNVTHWQPLPPTTEDSSAVDKEK